MSIPALPASPDRIILINPTKYLGNLLIAGNLVQQFVAHCRQRNIELRIVVDESFRELLQGALPAQSLIFYPRRSLAKAGLLQKIPIYWQCLGAIRKFGADIAFNVEEDSAAHRLTQLSGATYRLGCSPARHKLGYHFAMPISFTGREEGKEHRWYSFQEVFTALGMPASQEAAYLKLNPPPVAAAFKQKIESLGLDFSRKIVVIHAGATKAYKKWPAEHFAAMTSRLLDQNQQVAFIGAGQDATEIAAVLALVDSTSGVRPVNLCNQMSLAELAMFFQHVAAFAGNDSGPSHLAAAMGVPGFVIFGPTDVSIWGPLSSSTEVIKGSEPCGIECTRKLCLHHHRCLTSIEPLLVAEKLRQLA